MAVTMMAFGVNSIVAYPVGLIADQAGERATLAGLATVCMAVVGLGWMALRAVPVRPGARSPHPGPRHGEPAAKATGGGR
jgi:hypothetical protein